MATTNYEKVSTTKPKDLKVDVVPTITNVAKKMSFSASWSCGDVDYDAGQKFIYRWTGKEVNPGKSGDDKQWTDLPTRHAKGHSSAAINKSIRTITFAEWNFADYYPRNQSQHLRWIRVWVQGQRKKYDKKIKKKTHHYDPQWSDWAKRTIHILEPSKPVVSDPAAGETDFQKIFNWTVPQDSSWVGNAKADMEKFQIFYDCQWESILVNNNTEKYSSSLWKSTHAGYQTGTTTPGEYSGSVTITESNNTWTSYYSYTRYFRIRSRGPGGDSSWNDDKCFVYCLNKPPEKVGDGSTIRADGTGGYNANIMGINTVADVSYPFKYHLLQHCIAVPVTSINNGQVTISIPPEESVTWVDDLRVPPNTTGVVAQKINYNDVNSVRMANAGIANKPLKNNYTFHVDSYEIDDKLVWARDVIVGMDDTLTKGPSSVITPYPGRLPDPVGIGISDISVATHRVTVTATNRSNVAASYLVIYSRFSNKPDEKKNVGLLMPGEASVTVELDDWGENAIDIGVQAVLADYKGVTPTKIYMQSDIVWKADALPMPPTNLVLDSPRMGAILATWNWTWKEAESAEISWADHEDAWESTSQPETFIINNTNNGRWNITGLGVGTWYVRVRFIKRSGDVETYGMYSSTADWVISSVPTVPYLAITPSIVRPDGEITLTWLYSSEDGTAQTEVQIAKTSSLDTQVKKELSGTSLTLSASDLKPIGAWENGQTISLRLRSKSKAEMLSGWSEPATFIVASLPAKPILQFTQGWVSNNNVLVGEDTKIMDCVVSMPIRFSISGVDSTNKISVYIERASGTDVKRPDETSYPVYEGDVAYRNISYVGNATVTINQEDLIDYLDDKQDYNLIVKNTDAYGQTEETVKPFRVLWSHQAIEPEATISIDRENYVAMITPTLPQSRPSGWTFNAGDTCDIYRLSVDKPQLIVSGALLSPTTTYVDEYPTIGVFGGYRIVYKTVNGDYRTDGGYAMTDYSEDDDYIIDEFISIIDFSSDKVVLRYDLSLSNTWKKDFIETKYLGGSVQGDWNPGVSRTGTLKTTVSIEEDPLTEDPGSTIESMRRLAVYPGICHIRTPDGSSYFANVDVQEDREEKWVTRIAKFSLTITRVDDPGTFKGLTYDDYINGDED